MSRMRFAVLTALFASICWRLASQLCCRGHRISRRQSLNSANFSLKKNEQFPSESNSSCPVESKLAFVTPRNVVAPSYGLHAVSNTTSSRPDKVLLIDATGLAYRCFFALPELKTRNGTDIACLMGFMNSLARLFKMFNPKFVGLAFDSPGANRTKREVWPEYKTNRQVVKTSFRKQITWIRELCAIIGLPVFIKHTTEADDIINSIISFLRGNDPETVESLDKQLKEFKVQGGKVGGVFDKVQQRQQLEHGLQDASYDAATNRLELVPQETCDWRHKFKNGFDVVVVTADKDLLQILSNNNSGNVKVRIVQPHKKYRVVNNDTVFKEYGVTPERFSEYLALVGDAADNIPGVMGIGPKTAPKLIEKYSTFQEIIKSPEIQQICAKGGKHSASVDMAHDFHHITRLRKNVKVLKTPHDMIKRKTLKLQLESFMQLFSLSRNSYRWTQLVL